jgi:hypothetical protein
VRNAIIAVLGCLALAACGPSSTPLSRGLEAFRDGDRAALKTAQQDAETETKSAIQPGDNLCKATGEDVNKYHAVYALRQLDKDVMFTLPQEARLAYALKIAGHGAHVWNGTFLQDAPLFAVETPDNLERCKEERHAFMATEMAHAGYAMDQIKARQEVLWDWIAALKQKHGGEYETAMRAAVRRLEGEGYDVPWPAEVD